MSQPPPPDDAPVIDLTPSGESPLAPPPSGGRFDAVLRRVGDAPVSAWVTFAVVASCVAFVFLQLEPRLLLRDTTPAGGDMGAHVWAPAYLRDVLLPEFRLTGWTPDWYAGFPALHFYMVPPMLAIVLLDVVLPYGVAFKLVSVSGLVTLPIAAWAFGRLAGMAYPAPPLLAVGATFFLFDTTFSILGGNIPSTLAGEFAFSIGLTLSVLYLGLVANALQTGRHRALAAALIALVALTHVIPLFFAIAGTFVLLVVYPSGPAVRWIATTGVVGALLSMWWLLPFWWQRDFMNDMGWEKRMPSDPAITGEWFGFWLTRLFPPETRWVAFVALVGVIAVLVRRSAPGGFLVIMLIVGSVAFVVVPEGRLWNERLLPFVHLVTYMLAAVGVAEFLRWVTAPVKDPLRCAMHGSLALFVVAGARVISVVGLWPSDGWWGDVAGPVIATVVLLTLVYGVGQLVRWALAPMPAPHRGRVVSGGVGLVVLIALVALSLPLRSLPFATERADGSYGWIAPVVVDSENRSYIPSWVEWNYRGYEGKAAWPEFEDVLLTMGNLGQTNGCGRAMWEYDRGLDRYGTPMALMLLPFWTDGCIGSMEGLYFESSSTTPFHFLNQNALSTAPSGAQRNMPYTGFDVDLGVGQLQMMGVRYYMAESEQAINAATAHPDLVEIARSGPWVVFEVQDAPLVQSLANEPIVLEGVTDSIHDWIPATVDWFVTPSQWDLHWASSGPEQWQRTDRPDEAERRPLPEVEVTSIVEGTQSLSFEVSEPGVPMLVKTSYFPNWRVDGADGPYRVSPNLMVVVPTDTSVELTYGREPIEWASYALTGLGAVGLFALVRSGPLVMPRWRRDDEDPDDRPQPPPHRTLDHPIPRPPAPGDVRVSVVVPAFQEAGVIATTAQRLRAELAGLDGGVEIVVVDDGSSDGTADAAEDSGAVDLVVRQPRNMGKGAAVRAGALASSGRTIVFTDADLAYAPDQIAPLLAEIESGWDMVVGSRYVAGSVAEVPASTLRRVGGRLINGLVRLVLNGDHADTQCGLKAFRSDVARLLFAEARIGGFAFDVELFALAERHRLALRAVPVRVVNSTGSSVRVTTDAAALVADLVRIRSWMGRGGYPPVDVAALPPARPAGTDSEPSVGEH
ncbi:MAG: glycosyltransferase [Acidimicrobiales bacterium]